MKNIILFGISILFLSFMACGQTENHKKSNNNMDNQVIYNLNTTEFIQKMKEDNVQILDVRTPSEVENGTLENAHTLDFLAGKVSEAKDVLDPEVPVMVFCRSGGRSTGASKQLKQAGFKKIYNLQNAGYSNLAQELNQ